MVARGWPNRAPYTTLSPRIEGATMIAVRPGNELGKALGGCRKAFLGVAAMSGVVNLLYLTGSFFMLEVYDRVLPARSVPSLVAIGALAAALYAFQGIVEGLRGRVLCRIGTSLDESVNGRAFGLATTLPLRGVPPEAGQPVRDLDAVRAFLSSLGPTALFDLPWMPLYLGICFLFHPYIGLAGLAGAGVLCCLTLATERATKPLSRESTETGMRREAVLASARRNAETVKALGMDAAVGTRWEAANADHMRTQKRMADVAGGYGAASKVFRMALQSGVLALGAWLVISGLATGGVILASSILVSRALAPAELAIAHWKGFVAARQAWKRLGDLMARMPPSESTLDLPAPMVDLKVEGAWVVPPGTQRAVAQDVSLTLRAGQALGVIGPSGCGKTSLAKAVAGIWPPARGSVRLDGADLDRRSDLGRHVGYLPQEVDLFPGTVAENIARMAGEPDAAAVLAAARAAGAHDMVLRLPKAYETRVGEGGAGLSAGQRQRVGLARALYGNPFLVVLDEPNSNLDAEGEAALTEAIAGVRARGGVAFVVAHRPSALAAVDAILVMADGKPTMLGPRDEVMAKVTRPAGARPVQGGGNHAA